MVAAVGSLEFRIVASVIVQGFSLAAGVRRFCRDGQSCRGQCAREHQNQQQSGGQAAHRCGADRLQNWQEKNRLQPESMQAWRLVPRVKRRTKKDTKAHEVAECDPIKRFFSTKERAARAFLMLAGKSAPRSIHVG